MAAPAGGAAGMSDEQRDVYNELDAWYWQRRGMNATFTLKDAWRPHFNKLMAYMKELAALGLPDAPWERAAFDALFTKIMTQFRNSTERNEFSRAWADLAEEEYSESHMTNSGVRYGDYGEF